MSRTSTVTIHKDGTVTYYSWWRRALTRCLPEHIDSTDLSRMGRRDRDRLVSRFGTTTTEPPRRTVLMSAAQRQAGTERED